LRHAAHFGKKRIIIAYQLILKTMLNITFQSFLFSINPTKLPYSLEVNTAKKSEWKTV